MSRSAAKAREDWLIARLTEAREERDRYRGWFEKLLAAAWRGEPELRDELQRLRSERDHIVNARTRKRQATAAEKRQRAIEMYKGGELVKNIASDLARSERWVYDVVPQDLKRRR